MSQPGPLVVLVVDDDRHLRLLATYALRTDPAIEALEAESGEAALRHLSASGPRPDVVLLDLDMPGLGGRETAARIGELDPAIAVVLVSGDERASGDALPNVRGIIKKPFDPITLAADVRRLGGRS